MAGPDNAELLRHMARAGGGGEYDAEAERDLVRAVADATLLVPMRDDPDTGRPGLWATSDADGRTEVDGGDTLRLRTKGVGELHVRAPDPPAPEALEALRAAVAAEPVSGAWLLEATAPPPTHLVVVLELEPGARADADLAAVRAAAARLVPPEQFVDVMPLPGDDEVVARGRDVGLPQAQ